MENKDEQILQQMWYDVEQEGYTALKKAHVPLILKDARAGDVAALIINGYTEPVKYDSTPVISHSKATRLAEQYSRYPDYYRSLTIADKLDKNEDEVNLVLRDYQVKALDAICLLKDYLGAMRMAETLNTLSGTIGVGSNEIKGQIDGFNAECRGAFLLRRYDGKVIVSNSSTFCGAWRKRCSLAVTSAIRLKTYMKVYKQWLGDTGLTRFAPTSVIRMLANPFKTMDYDEVPEEYRMVYDGDVSDGQTGLFPNYASTSVDYELEDELNKELNGWLKKRKA